MVLIFMNEENVNIRSAQEMIEGVTFGEMVSSEGCLAKQ